MNEVIVQRLHRVATHLSHGFGAVLFAAIVGTGLEATRIAEAKAEAERETRLVQLQFEQHEITCLTNVAHHEARGELVGVRELVIKTVLAIIGDDEMRLPKTVCALAQVPGFFSQLKNLDRARFADPIWTKINGEVADVYYGSRTLPRGWGCVRAFRVSDDTMEKMSGKALAQLGFTVRAKGLKYFAAHRVPVDTRGRVTFYSPRGGCGNPSPTT